MKFIAFAFKNLGRRRIRTGLTVFGIVIAIAFAFMLFSLSEGAKEVIAVERARGPDIEVKPIRGFTIDENYATALAEMEGIRIATPAILVLPEVLEAWGFISVAGLIPSGAQEAYEGLEIAQGRHLTDNDKFATLLGYQASKNNNLKVGDNIKLIDVNFEVIGILAKAGGFVDMVMTMPIWDLQTMLKMENKATSIWIWVENEVDVQTKIDEIENNYPELRAAEGLKILEAPERFMKYIDAVGLIMAVVALLIGALVAMNTITMSTMERTREFGTMRSLGASSTYVFKLVLTESMLLSMISGLIGCLVGYAGSIAIENFFLSTEGLDVVAITMRVPLATISLVAVVGLLVGIYPARRISRSQIVEALRYE